LHEPSVPTIQALLLLANSLGAQGIAGNGSMLYLKIGEYLGLVEKAVLTSCSAGDDHRARYVRCY
jgi:hypothetical protein